MPRLAAEVRRTAERRRADWSLGHGSLLQMSVATADGLVITFECDDSRVSFEPVYEDDGRYDWASVFRNPARLVGYRINAATQGGTLNMTNPRLQPSDPKENHP